MDASTVKVGLIDADGGHTITQGDALTTDGKRGVQFKTSSKYSGTLPLYVKLRARITFG